MATGDLKNNVFKLQQELKLIHFKGKFNSFGLQSIYCRISNGDPSAFLPLLHAALLGIPIVARYFSDKNYDLFGKNDARFLESGSLALIY
jgi:hypothetical protein